MFNLCVVTKKSGNINMPTGDQFPLRSKLIAGFYGAAIVLYWGEPNANGYTSSIATSWPTSADL